MYNFKIFEVKFVVKVKMFISNYCFNSINMCVCVCGGGEF